MSANHLFCFGLGYSALGLARRLLRRGWRVSGTARGSDRLAELAAIGVTAHAFDGAARSVAVVEALRRATHILVSIPPDGDGDPALRHHGHDIAAGKPCWLGYLSTIGVYGDQDGRWCDEETPLAPLTARGERRIAAEQGWSALARNAGIPAGLFRLAGIYGPGRNQLESVLAGSARRLVKAGQVFNRIHVDDIASVLEASIATPPVVSRAYNVCDDEPAPPQDVIAFAAQLLERAPPPEIAFDDADLSPMARSFYAGNKRCSNARIKRELSVQLTYPTYREGLRALLQSAVKPSSTPVSRRKS